MLICSDWWWTDVKRGGSEKPPQARRLKCNPKWKLVQNSRDLMAAAREGN
jgi:hypothetical protein